MNITNTRRLRLLHQHQAFHTRRNHRQQFFPPVHTPPSHPSIQPFHHHSKITRMSEQSQQSQQQSQHGDNNHDHDHDHHNNNNIPHYNQHYYQVIHQLPHSLPEYPYDQIRTNTIASLDYFNHRMRTLPKDQKQDYTVQKSIAFRFAHEWHTHCHYCWVTIEHCHCHVMVPLDHSHVMQCAPRLEQVEVVYLMTYKELHRASNSAKIVLNSFRHSRLLIRGLHAHERELQDRYIDPYRSGDLHLYVLFPSTDSISIHESQLVNHFHKNNNNNNNNNKNDTEQTDDDNEQNKKKKKHVILVIDGTWREARRMNKTLPPDIVRIRLQPLSNPLFDGLRKQLFPGSRTSTCEATVLLLRELGMHNEHCDGILNNLKIMINHVRKMSNKQLISFDE